MYKSPSRQLAGLALILAGLLLFVLFSERPGRLPPLATEGTLDLSGWDFANDGLTRLDGQWEFLWGAAGPAEHRGPLNPSGPADRYPVPAIWGKPTALGRAVSPHGLAAYRLRVRLPSGNEPHALHLSGMLSACRVWVDGRLVGASGEIDDNGRETPRKHCITPVFVPSGPEAEIVLEVANHTNVQGGLNAPILIGTRDQVQRLVSVRWLTGALIAGMLLAMSAYHLIIFVMRRTDRSNLYFGLFALAWAANTLLSPASGFVLSEFTTLSWRWYIMLTLLPYAVTTPLMILLYHALFPKPYARVVNAFFSLLGGAYAIYLLAAGPSAFGPIPLLYFMVTRTAFLYLFTAFAVDIVRRERGVLLLVPGYLALGYAELCKILYDLHVTASAEFAPYGMLAFILSYAVFMAVRFSQAFSNAERLAGELGSSNERLEHLDKLKDTFLANATHELKTPLAGMVGIAESLLAGAGGSLTEAATGHLHMLAYSGKRLSRLVDDVLDHARLKNMDVQLSLELVHFETTAKRVLALARGLAADKGLELRDNLSPDLPPIRADSGRLEQILFNLVGNAIKYTNHGFVELSASVARACLEVRVADSGIGIAAEEQELIFASFTQVATGDAAATGGAGLGLAIASRLVELHGGTLRVASSPNQGSVFSFTLPLGDNAPSCAPPRGPAPSAVGDTARFTAVPGLPPLPSGASGPDYDVLVVDDESVNLHVVATCLAVSDLTVKAVRSGAEALALLAAGDDPGVVLLDVMMPDRDGYDVCREIRGTRSAVSLPVVMLTCRNRVEDVVEGFAAGANDYVTKPFARAELVARVSTQLDLRRAHRVLEDNISLRREVAMRRQTEQALRLWQIRLSRMLDAIGEAVFAVNQSGEIAFCNQSFADLTGRPAREALGQPLIWLLAEPDAPAAKLLRDGLRRLLDGGGDAENFEAVGIVTQKRGPQSCRIHAKRVALAEEPMLLLHLCPSDAGRGQDAAVLVDMLRKVEGNRLRLQRIGEALQTMAAGEAQAAALQDLTALDALLENICDRMSGNNSEQADKILAVHVMQTALACWCEATGLGKGELAVQSGLWNAYMERDGYLRTQTLDKYLSLGTLPGRPRWRSIIATAEYVLSACPDSPRYGNPLRHLLERLRQLESDTHP